MTIFPALVAPVPNEAIASAILRAILDAARKGGSA